ncbi:helix-turn-helix domain-containing protein [Kitasatospora sp. NPDC088346]|uniref:helix-turn-helix domain-containing protein n=1 Tax=Kitasatospora sp. NPDC088346 TaxID=3364073 RepID=UPI00380A425F
MSEIFAAVDALLAKARDGGDLPEPAERERLREAAGLTQVEVAAALDTRRGTFAKWEAGAAQPRSPKRGAYAFLLAGKGASMVGALRQLVRAVRRGERDAEALSGIAEAHTKRRTTKGGQKARVRGKDTVGEAGGSMAGRAGTQAIRSGVAHLAPVVHETGQTGGKLAFTVRMKADQYVYSAGSEQDSGGLRRGFAPRGRHRGAHLRLRGQRRLRRRRVVPARRRRWRPSCRCSWSPGARCRAGRCHGIRCRKR